MTPTVTTKGDNLNDEGFTVTTPRTHLEQHREDGDGHAHCPADGADSERQ